MRNTLLFLFIFLVAGIARAQEGRIPVTGKVTTEDGKEGLAGVSVTVKGTHHGTTTGQDGTYHLTLGPEDKVLVISYNGYDTQTLDARGGAAVSILLRKNSRQLDDVIVTGYSTQNRKYIAGSIATVNGDAIHNIPEAGFNQLLQGKTAGVQVTSNSGVPGGGITFRVRGYNSINASVDPLYVIDGVFVSTAEPIQTSIGNQEPSNPLADINPSDIESIQILKDANATAIYGSLGANGVILVTTKRGRLNAKPRVNLDVYHGWSDAIKKFQVTNGPETGLLTNESAINTAIDNGQNPSTITLPFSNPDTLPTYDRIKDIFRTAATNNYDLSVQGGSDKSTYYASLGYLRQESIVKPSDYERYTARLNYDSYVSSLLKIGTSLNLTRNWRNVSSNDNNPQGVINSALFTRSYLPIYNANGTYARYGSFDNPIALIKNLDNNAVGWRTIGNLYAELSFLPTLKLRSSVSVDNNDEYENDYANTLISAGIATNGAANSYETKNTVFTNEQVLTYINSFGADRKHSINALVGNTFESVLSQSTSASGTGFAANSLTAISTAATTTGSSSSSQANLVSFFGKASYTYDNKYTVDGSVRADGSSKFGADKRWGYFPSAGLAWRASQENFIKELNIFDELKLRASLGWSGNQNGIGPYAAQGLWSGTNSGSSINYNNQAGTAPSQLANPNLTWETTRQTDIGIEFGILHNRLNLVADYYDKYTYDLLLNVPVPSRSGFTNFLQNYGAVSNKGIELTLQSVNVRTADFRWTTDFNISTNKNRIVKLASDIAQGASGRNISILRQGYAVNSFWLYKQLSVDPQTGNAVYQDVDHSGTITAADRQIVGNALPKFTGGLNNNLAWRQFDLGFLFYFDQGNKIMNMNDFFLIHGGTQKNIGFVPRQLERWQKAGDKTDIPRLTTYSGNPTQNDGAANNYGGNVASLSSRYLEDGSFIRLKTISFGYTLPKGLLDRWKISSARLYVQATNLWTQTKYKGLDPEVSSQSNNQNTVGYDWATVPQPRTLQAGLNLTF
jgi:TonB-dependent starch-binding outer membrane protein SusC